MSAVRTGAQFRHPGWQQFLNSLLIAQCHFPRLDWAFDDLAGRLDMDIIANHIRQRWYSTRFRTVVLHEAMRTGTGTMRGHMVTFGSRTSDICVRLYDKHLEQLSRPIASLPERWVRVEVEAHNCQAQALAKAFGQQDVSAVSNDLRARLDFKVSGGDTNRSRWKTVGWWADFLAESAKARIAATTRDRTLDDIAEHIELQYAPWIALLTASSDFGDSWLEQVVRNGNSRLEDKHLSCIVSRNTPSMQNDANDLNTACAYAKTE